MTASLSIALGMASAQSRNWFTRPAYAATPEGGGPATVAALIADFRRRRYAVTRVASQLIAAATPAALTQMASCGFEDLISFSRGSTASYVDALGQVRLAAANVPRFDWTTGAGALLVERASANMLLQSQTLSAAVWNRPSSVLPGQVLSAGTLTLESVRRTGDVFGGLQQAVSILDGMQYTFSVFVSRQDGGVSWFGLYNNTDAVWQTTVQLNWPAASVPLTVAHVSVPSNGQRNPPVDIRIEPLTNGIYRMSFTFTATSVTGDSVSVNAHANRLTDVTGNYFGGFQLETSSFVTSYIPTGTTTVPRAADRCRLQPVAEALLQRGEATVLLQTEDISGAGGCLLGSSQASLLGTGSDGARLIVGSVNPLPIAVNLTKPLPALGCAFTFDASGKAGCHNSGDLASHGLPMDADRIPSYLGDDGNGNIASGRYQSLVLWPFRATGPSLQARAVPYGL